MSVDQQSLDTALISDAMRVLGRRRSERKAAASRANLAAYNTLRPLADLACTCGAGMALAGHHSHCPRGRAIKRRGLLPPA